MISFLLGLFVGGFIGIATICLCVVARDDNMNRGEEK